MERFYTVPNQKVITTNKAKADNKNVYSKINIEAVKTAARLLTDRAFKLFMRMDINKDGFTYALSPTLISKEIGMSETKYREAVKELTNKGFLKQSDKQKNFYDFIEFPETQPKINVVSVCNNSKDCTNNLQRPSTENTLDRICEKLGLNIENTTDRLCEIRGETMYNTEINNKDDKEKDNVIHADDDFYIEDNTLSDKSNKEIKDIIDAGVRTILNDDSIPF